MIVRSNVAGNSIFGSGDPEWGIVNQHRGTNHTWGSVLADLEARRAMSDADDEAPIIDEEEEDNNPLGGLRQFAVPAPRPGSLSESAGQAVGKAATVFLPQLIGLI